jgi:biotin operon repressor/predicted RNA-binding Zn-ribbon protein involved in translation (DUF1610 family)
MQEKIKINQENYYIICEVAKISNSINDLAIKLGWKDYPTKKKLKELLLKNKFDITVFPNANAENSIFNNQSKLQDAVKKSFNYTEVIKLFTNKVAAGHYPTLKRYIKKFNLDISHFSPYKNVTLKSKKIISNEEMFIANSLASSSAVRKRIIKEKLLPYKCQCGNEGVWRNKKMTLQMDHKNGNRTDNRLENLEFLCPNCHVITPTYGSKNKVSNKRSIKEKKTEKAMRIKDSLKTIKNKKIEDNKDLILNNLINYNSFIDILNAVNLPRNSKNYAALNNFFDVNKNPEVDEFLKRVDRKIQYPYLKKLKKLIQEKGYSKVAEELGCSDRGLRKHIDSHTKKIVNYPDIPILKQMVEEKGYAQVARELGCSLEAVRKHIFRNDTEPKAPKKKIVYPEVPLLITMVAEKGFVQVGKELGCSDNAVRKYLKKNKIDLTTISINGKVTV